MHKITPIVLAGLFSASSLAVLANEKDKIDFDRHDTDNSGALSQMEWRDVQGVNVSFSEADKDGDGQVTKKEAKSAAKQEKSGMGYQQTAGSSQSGQSADSPMLGEKSFDELDEDADGKLSRQEASTDAELESHFAVLDQNGDDQLDRDELKQVHAVSGQHDVTSGGQDGMSEVAGTESAQSETISIEQAGSAQDDFGSAQLISETTFEQVDMDGDDRISRDEAEQSGNDYVLSAFETVDENSNDYIEKDEIESDNQQ